MRTHKRCCSLLTMPKVPSAMSLIISYSPNFDTGYTSVEAVAINGANDVSISGFD